MCLGLFRGQIFCLAKNFNLKIVSFESHTTWTTLEVKMPSRPDILTGKFGRYLVECGGSLILVLFAIRDWPVIGIDLYRLDFPNRLWVKIDTLGDACLFVDAVGNVPIVCQNPSRWGGKSNRAYIIGPGCENWTEFQFGKDIIASTEQSALKLAHAELPRWPSPVWVYPSMLC
ncbi:uncharacterized protein A4U43_C08F1220 [Asparagus officinalis]|nr:uncharacterized protein A4U43_C08F1220 [Asparagus officinalis]